MYTYLTKITFQIQTNTYKLILKGFFYKQGLLLGKLTCNIISTWIFDYVYSA